MKTINLLEQLTARAQAFAKCYSVLSEALIKEGVPEKTAREEAGRAAYLAAICGEYQRPEDQKPWDIC